jgi:hypothetical protein
LVTEQKHLGRALLPREYKNVVDALRQSVKVESGGSTERGKISGSSEGRAAKKPSRPAAKQRKAG